MTVPDHDLQRFLRDVEQSIAEANRQIIHDNIPGLTKSAVMPLAESVARLRARYLQAAFDVAQKDEGQGPDLNEIKTLRRYRESYEETRAAFDALIHAIERGYVDLTEE
jgi:hypothetical protein